MDITSQQYQAAGFFSSGSIGFIHFQDIFMALVLGFVGALGAYIFKRLVDYIEKENRK